MLNKLTTLRIERTYLTKLVTELKLGIFYLLSMIFKKIKYYANIVENKDHLTISIIKKKFCLSERLVIVF
jgi:predicted DNA-binding transcriptional regulator